MSPEEFEKLRFPVGRFNPPETLTLEHIPGMIETIRQFPDKVSALINDLPIDALNWKYRPGGWSAKQVVHHCADSHMNALIRFKLALTEDEPTIRPYYEDRWAELMDSRQDDLLPSVFILGGVHRRWTQVMQSMILSDWNRGYIHPEYNRRYTLYQALGNYDWHCKHHLEHLRLAIQFNGKYNDM